MQEIELKLNDVVGRGQLSLSSVQHTLKHPDLLPGMPEAGSQGRHRLFTVPQAMRLAICVHLVMGGVGLADAGRFVLAAERRARALLGIGVKQPLSFRELLGKNPWILRVFDYQHFQVWQVGRSHRLMDSLDFWNLATGEWRIYAEEPRFVRYELDLTTLERTIAAA